MRFLASLVAGACTALVFTAAPASGIPGQGTWETTLQPRDLDGDGVADAYHDTVLDLTWLADANLYGTLHGTDGRTDWVTMSAWAAGLNLHGVTGWHLPGVRDGAFGGGFPVPDPDLSDSPLMHMWYSTLGNANQVVPNDDPFNPGPFRNLVTEFETPAASLYWTSRFDASTASAWGFAMASGVLVDAFPVDYPFIRGWLVHDGDVSPVPEPASAPLLLAGVAWLAGVLARRRR